MLLLPKIDLKLEVGYSDHMTGEQLVAIVKRLLETDADLDFLSRLTKLSLKHLLPLCGTGWKILENPDAD